MARYCIENFGLYQYHLAEKRLESMAKKGWMLQKPGSFFWKYRSCGPENARFSMIYSPEAAGNHPNPAGELEKLQGYAREMGWEYAGQWRKMQIFYTSSPDAPSLQEDEKIRQDTFAYSLKESRLAVAILPALWLLVLAGWIVSILDDPVWMLSRPGVPGFLLEISLLVICWAMQAADYLIYSRKVLKNGENGVLPWKILPRIIPALVLVCTAILFTLVGLLAFPGMAWWGSAGIVLGAAAAFSGLTFLCQSLLQKLGVRSQRWYTAVHVCCLVVLLLSIGGAAKEYRENYRPPETPLPLTAADLTGEGIEPEYTSHQTGASAVLQMERVYQRMPGDEGIPILWYQRLSTPFGFLRRYLAEESAQDGGEFLQMESAPSPAEAAYQLWINGEARQEYLFVRGNRTVQVRFGFPADQSQLETAAQKLLADS